MSANPFNPIVRKPGPFAGQARRCAHGGCLTLLHQYHEGDICHAHEHLHLDEPVEELRLDPRNLPTPAVRELARAGW